MKYRKDFLEALYRTMQRIRVCEESFVDPIIKKEILCPVHLYTGQEAIAAGVCANLRAADYVFGSHRSHGHYLAKGASLEKLVSEIYCKETGCCKGRGGSMHVSSQQHGVLGVAPIVGGTIALAVGAALAAKVRGEDRIAVSFFGDGATGEGVLYESMNFASLRKLPVIFVCENNLYSTHLPIRECRPKNTVVEIAASHGFPGWEVDGNDVLAVYEVAKKAVSRCRKGAGPSLIECHTYRMRGHVGPSDNIQGTLTDIRPKKEIAEWKKRDPIVRFERYLLKDSRFSKTELHNILKMVKDEVTQAHESARRSPWPRPEELLAYVYSTEEATV